MRGKLQEAEVVKMPFVPQRYVVSLIDVMPSVPQSYHRQTDEHGLMFSYDIFLLDGGQVLQARVDTWTRLQRSVEPASLSL